MSYYLAILLALCGFWLNDAVLCNNPEDLGNGITLCH
jgi:hypothetical protein